MIELATSQAENATGDSVPDGIVRGPFIWGFDARELHDAWWRGRGVQCIRRGVENEFVAGVELFMLLEPEELVAFELSAIADAMVWGSAVLRRVRIVEHCGESYKEKIARDSSGRVCGIRRSYSEDAKIRSKVCLTDRSNIARSWSKFERGKSAWRELRRLAGNSVGHDRVSGRTFDFVLPEDRAGFLQWIVASWEDPERVIEGVSEIAPGIRALKGGNIKSDDVCLPPLWIGNCGQSKEKRILVGPEFLEDGRPVSSVDCGVRIMEMREILLPRNKRQANLIPRESIYSLFKRLFDLVFATLVLVGLSPVFILVGLLVFLDDGFPLFFGHVRQKQSGAVFTCWKFRTMRRNAEAMVHQFVAENKADGPQVFIENDPRVTRIGHVLRKLQLDELPQFFNVLTGDMSVVGPRPSPEKENQYCPAWRELRLSVRPGITGLWQVERTRAPGEDFQEWIKYDIDYVRRASFWLDLKICFKTVRNLLLPS